jgi:DNA-binding response OmpR family regulator
MRKRMRVLIVEDDEDFRLSLSDMLSKAGFAVEAVGDGLSALRMSGRADVLLTDIGIPGMDGLELLSRAKAQVPSLAVLVMTGYDSPRSRAEACRRGAAAYLPKPFEKATLLELLNCLEGRIEKPSEPSGALFASGATTRGPRIGVRGPRIKRG